MFKVTFSIGDYNDTFEVTKTVSAKDMWEACFIVGMQAAEFGENYGGEITFLNVDFVKE